MSSRRSRKRRDGNDEGAEPEVQVFAKRSRIDRCPQVAVRRGHDSSVHFDAAFGAHSADFSFLQSPEELGLHGRSNLADLVQENRAAAGDLEEARLVANRAGKCASHVAEQFRFEQRFGERSAIDAHEWRGGARALIVDQADDELLAGAAFAVHEHGGVERRDTGRQFQHILHRLAAGDEVLRRCMAVDALAQKVQLTFTPFQEPSPARSSSLSRLLTASCRRSTSWPTVAA